MVVPYCTIRKGHTTILQTFMTSAIEGKTYYKQLYSNLKNYTRHTPSVLYRR